MLAPEFWDEEVDEGPGDMYCGLDDQEDEGAVAVAVGVGGREAAEGLSAETLKLIERRREAAVARKQQLDAARSAALARGGGSSETDETLDEAMVQRIERNRSAALARRQRWEAKKALKALQGLTVGQAVVEEEDGIVSAVRRVTLPACGMR